MHSRDGSSAKITTDNNGAPPTGNYIGAQIASAADRAIRPAPHQTKGQRQLTDSIPHAPITYVMLTHSGTSSLSVDLSLDHLSHRKRCGLLNVGDKFWEASHNSNVFLGGASSKQSQLHHRSIDHLLDVFQPVGLGYISGIVFRNKRRRDAAAFLVAIMEWMIPSPEPEELDPSAIQDLESSLEGKPLSIIFIHPSNQLKHTQYAAIRNLPLFLALTAYVQMIREANENGAPLSPAQRSQRITAESLKAQRSLLMPELSWGRRISSTILWSSWSCVLRSATKELPGAMGEGGRLKHFPHNAPICGQTSRHWPRSSDCRIRKRHSVSKRSPSYPYMRMIRCTFSVWSLDIASSSEKSKPFLRRNCNEWLSTMQMPGKRLAFPLYGKLLVFSSHRVQHWRRTSLHQTRRLFGLSLRPLRRR